MQVVFMTSNPFIEQQKIDMYVDAVREICTVQLWDLSRIYNRKEKVSDQVQEAVKINSCEELDQKLKQLIEKDKVSIVTNITIPALKKIYSIIKSCGIPIININKEGLAAWLGDTASAENLKEENRGNKLKFFLKKYRFFRSVINGIKYPHVKYDYLLSSYNFYPEESRKFVKIHQIKYDEFLMAKNQDSIIDGKYILFIDAALVGHPMFASSVNQMDRNEYIESLNRYFRMLEEKYHTPVVISSHPKANYSENDFEGRKIIKYKTPVLIQHCEFIVSHYSTSLIDAVLMKKPIKVLYSDSLLKSSCRYCVLMGIKFADLLNLDKVDLAHPEMKDFSMNEQTYQQFTEKYIVNVSESGKSNKQLIISFFQDLSK